MTTQTKDRLASGKKLGGRPAVYTSPEDLQIAVDNYFLHPKKRVIVVGNGDRAKSIEISVLTITGLMLSLGFCDRSSFYEYEKKPEFSHTIKYARQRIEQEYEELLQRGLGAGAIFALKNFGWKEDPTTIIDQSIHTHNTLKIDLTKAEQPELIASLLGRHNGRITESQR